MINAPKIGDKVCYVPKHYEEDGRYENGIIKEIPQPFEDHIRVVYNCGGDWTNYFNYTSALTHVRDLYPGWQHK